MYRHDTISKVVKILECVLPDDCIPEMYITPDSNMYTILIHINNKTWEREISRSELTLNNDIEYTLAKIINDEFKEWEREQQFDKYIKDMVNDEVSE